ncbi:MAG: hypothetical protein HFJ36_00870, partial [Clostridia bacterium]|nr:hypothetical protein [Clostridia bacterium]
MITEKKYARVEIQIAFFGHIWDRHRYAQKGYSVPVPDMPKRDTQCLSQICPK